MHVRVEGQEFIKVLNAICSAKQVINFTIDGDSLLIEVFEPLIVSIPIRILEIKKQFEGDNYKSISIEINNSYNLIPDQCDVTLDIGKDVLTILAPGYECRFRSAYEDRFNMPTTFSSEFKELESGAGLENVVRLGQYIATFSKFMQVEEPAIIVKERQAYIMSSSVAIKTSLNFPDSTWIRNVLKAMNAVFKSHYIDRPTLKINNGTGVYGVINFDESSEMAFSMRFTHNSQIDAVNGVIEGLQRICSIHVEELSDKVKIIEKIYKKADVDIAIGEGTYFIKIRVGNDSELIFGTRNSENKIYMIDASIPLLSLINNIFKSSAVVDIYGGNRYVMFRDSNNLLLTTGLTQI